MDSNKLLIELKESGPGTFCEYCGHFAGRHNDLECHFTRANSTKCQCTGFVFKNTKFDMDFWSGPIGVHSFDTPADA